MQENEYVCKCMKNINLEKSIIVNEMDFNKYFFKIKSKTCFKNNK